MIDHQRKLQILAGCMSILDDSDHIEDIMFAIRTIIKMEQLSGETFIKIEFPLGYHI